MEEQVESCGTAQTNKNDGRKYSGHRKRQQTTAKKEITIICEIRER